MEGCGEGSIPCRGNSIGEDSEAGACLAELRNSQEATTATVKGKG